MVSAFATHDDLAGSPVDIIDLQSNDFWWPQSKTGQ
jgi:hypothetical protein